MNPDYETRYNALDVDLKTALNQIDRLVCGYPSGNEALAIIKGVLIGQANEQTQHALTLAQLNATRAKVKRLQQSRARCHCHR